MTLRNNDFYFNEMDIKNRGSLLFFVLDLNPFYSIAIHKNYFDGFCKLANLIFVKTLFRYGLKLQQKRRPQ